MSKRLIPVLIFIPACLLVLCAPAWAANDDAGVAVQKLMQAHACSACHAATVKRIGPAWSWVAWRYRDKPKKSSVNEVANFIISGGTGYWAKWTGGIAMPAHPGISKKQAKAIARWVLSQPPAQPPQPGG